LPYISDARRRQTKRTEEAEQKKFYIERNHMLEEDAKKLQMQLNNLNMEKEELMRQNSQLSQQVKNLICEIERLVENHMLETADLRERISHFTEQSEFSAQLLPSQPISEFSEFVSEMDPIWPGILLTGTVDSDQDKASSS
jgi:hypothetical protein